MEREGGRKGVKREGRVDGKGGRSAQNIAICRPQPLVTACPPVSDYRESQPQHYQHVIRYNTHIYMQAKYSPHLYSAV